MNAIKSRDLISRPDAHVQVERLTLTDDSTRAMAYALRAGRRFAAMERAGFFQSVQDAAGDDPDYGF